MNTPARTLAEFAVGLRYEDIPPAAIDRAKTALIDTIGAMTFGAQLPWSRIVVEYVQRTSAPATNTRFATRLTVKLKDGRELSTEAHDYEGMPQRPLAREQLRAKFLQLTSGTKAYDPEAVLAKLEKLKTMESVSGLFD